jgi:hypothetical protein
MIQPVIALKADVDTNVGTRDGVETGEGFSR